MGSVNVNRNVADAFYRYKMPRICAKVEGKGNGIKTVIVNMPEVAKAIGRPATYPTKYFGCELGAQTQFDFKNERFIVNGSHDSAKLQDLLDGFIRKFVLCPECDNPETELIVSTKRNTISQGCKACGYHGPLEFNHKLNTFILKNPPAADHGVQGSSLTEGNRGKRSKRSGPAANGNHDGDAHDAKAESDVPVTPTTPNPKSKKEKKKAADDDGDDDNWTVDVSEAAVRARMQDLTEGAKSMTLSEDSEKNEKQRMDLFYSFLKQRSDAGDVEGSRAVNDILHEADRLEVKSKALLVAFEVLVGATTLAADVRRHRVLLLRLARADPKAPRAALHALTALAATTPALLPRVPAVLKLLYDLDIVEEKTILEWAAKPSRKFAPKEVVADVLKRAQPFIDWLQQADEEESSDDASEEDIEIEYDDRAKATPIKAMAAPASKPKQEEDGDIDVDIDAI